MRPGNTNCGGCGMSIALTMIGRILAEATEIHAGHPRLLRHRHRRRLPHQRYNVPVLGATFGSSPAFATGVAAVRDLNGDEEQVINWAGDGGTYDIGMATLSAAAERNENFIYICYDNEIYGNTGGQRSSAPRPRRPHHHDALRQGWRARRTSWRSWPPTASPYAATLSLAHPEDSKPRDEDPSRRRQHGASASCCSPHPLALPHRMEERAGNVDMAAVTDFVKARYDRLRTLSDAFPINGD
jgi:pyruvate/2-oxoacid:ferredoxin oxidoreductase beta subunit